MLHYQKLNQFIFLQILIHNYLLQGSKLIFLNPGN